MNAETTDPEFNSRAAMEIEKMNEPTKLKAQAVPFSSVVGSGVMFTNEAGAAVINIAIMVPSPSFDYRETADPFVKRLVELWNGANNV